MSWRVLLGSVTAGCALGYETGSEVFGICVLIVLMTIAWAIDDAQHPPGQ